MKTTIFCFTEQGSGLAERIQKHFSGKDDFAVIRRPGKGDASVLADLEKAFDDGETLVFVGAAGIAVRLIAPFVKDKFTDPPVLCCDEKGTFVIPLLSGHAGGANDLARKLAACLGAVPVITTATDLSGLFAVDVFAKDNRLAIEDRTGAKKLSAALLSGGKIGFFCRWKTEGSLPYGLTPGEEQENNLLIGETPEKEGKDSLRERILSGGRTLLVLKPKRIAAGIGCRRGTPGEMIREALLHVLEEEKLGREDLFALATVSRKAGEPGLRLLSKELGVPLLAYPADELEALSGEFEDSDFVRKTVGTGNVCERAAFLSASKAGENPRIIRKKQVFPGVTCALAAFDPVIRFREEWGGNKGDEEAFGSGNRSRRAGEYDCPGGPLPQ